MDLIGRHTLVDGYAHAAVITCIQTKLTKVQMVSKRNLELIILAISLSCYKLSCVVIAWVSYERRHAFVKWLT